MSDIQDAGTSELGRLQRRSKWIPVFWCLRSKSDMKNRITICMASRACTVLVQALDTPVNPDTQDRVQRSLVSDIDVVASMTNADRIWFRSQRSKIYVNNPHGLSLIKHNCSSLFGPRTIRLATRRHGVGQTNTRVWKSSVRPTLRLRWTRN